MAKGGAADYTTAGTIKGTTQGPDAGAGLTQDKFLGGRLQVWQPETGYRAGVDPVLLAASVPACASTVLELGAGVGVASLCLARRLAHAQVYALELQPDYAALAQRNAQENGLPITVYQGDLVQMPAPLRQMRFDHVIANPPYFLRDRSLPAQDKGRETGMGEGVALAQWVMAAARRTRDKGHVTFICRVERLPELVALFSQYLGSVEVQPITPRKGRESQLVLIRGRKGGRAAFRLHAGLVMHQGHQHTGDRNSYTPAIQAVLQAGAALPWGGG